MIRFQPIYQQRVWGGREMSHLFARQLPADGLPYGESWEICDRPEAQSMVREASANFSGLIGQSLHELWAHHRASIFGADAPESERFPLLIKILDARERLSIQVHPPQSIAASMGGEAKTEMWYVVDATADASLYVGVKKGTSRELFSAALKSGRVESLVPELPVAAGDFIFIPSGRLHAIGAGLVIFEIQQNSDTTYRVFDWNRIGLDGKPRQLHINESPQCIDFSDDAPSLGTANGSSLVACDYFEVEKISLPPNQSGQWGHAGEFSILAIASGSAALGASHVSAGDFAIIPATMDDSQRRLVAGNVGADILKVCFGKPASADLLS